MPNAVADVDPTTGAAEDAELLSDERIPDWRYLPPVPITNVRSMDAGDVPESIKRQVLDPTVFNTVKPFTFTAYGSNHALDAYSTQMQDSSLKNYAAEAKEGRSFLDSHRYRELPIGRTHDGTFKAGSNKRAEMDVYMLPDSMAGRGGDTNSIIDHIRAGIYSDVSIGFAGGKMICSICDLEMVDSWYRWLMDEDTEEVCLHVAGVEYPKKGKDGKPTGETELAIGKIEDAHLRELSVVYMGATPGAAIVKARSMAEYGMLPPADARVLERIYARERILFPTAQRTFLIPRPRAATAKAAAAEVVRDDKPEERETPMPPDEHTNGTTTAPDPLEPIRALVRDVGWAPEGEWSGDGPALMTLIRERAAKFTALESDAAAGRQYKDELVRYALDEGVRARGDKFSRDKWEPILRKADPETIRLYLDDWGVDARAFFIGGRQTVETEQRQAEPTSVRPARAIPIAAFAG